MSKQPQPAFIVIVLLFTIAAGFGCNNAETVSTATQFAEAGGADSQILTTATVESDVEIVKNTSTSEAIKITATIVADATTLPAPTPTPVPATRTAIPVTASVPAPTEIATAVAAAPPAATSTPVPTPPPYHFLTAEEVEAALPEVGCSGWKQVQIGEIIYNRVCANDDNYAANVLGTTGTRTSGSGSERENCESVTDGSVRFTAAPTDLSLVRSIVPPGSPSAETIAGHSYIHNVNAATGESMRVPVYAVADSTLRDMAYYISNDGKWNFYFLAFDVTCEVGYIFDHIVEVVPKIAAVAPTTASISSATDDVRTTFSFEAGELIGYVGEGTWDFGASDTAHINQFANQPRYIGTAHEGALHQICPYDLYDDPLSGQFYSLFADPGGTLGVVDHCNPARDVLGSAAGRWFDSIDYETGRQALGIAMLPGDTVQMSTVSRSLRVHNDNPTWVDPELMTTSHCYVDSGEWFYLEMLVGGMQMAVAIGDGSCPNSLPESATVYYR